MRPIAPSRRTRRTALLAALAERFRTSTAHAASATTSIDRGRWLEDRVVRAQVRLGLRTGLRLQPRGAGLIWPVACAWACSLSLSLRPGPEA